MISIILSLLLVTDYIGVDLGSQYLKLSTSTGDGQVKIYTNPISNSVILSEAVALKFSKPHTPPFTVDDFADIDVRFSRRAISLLKHNSSLGYEFTPMMIKRNFTNDFNISSIVHPEELLPLLLYQAFYQVAPFKKVSIALPTYLTAKQFRSVSSAFLVSGADVDAIVDDMTATLVVYSALRVNRYSKEPKHILFVDVGASTTRAYSAVFSYQKEPLEHSAINQTSYGFTEKVSGIAIAKALAKNTKTTFHKAMKTIIRTNGEGKEEYFTNEINELTNFIKEIVEQATKERPIDEVQLIGGASTMRFVVDTIKTAANHTIRRDFNANEAVAMGAAMIAMMMKEESAYIPAFITKRPSMSINAICGNETQIYCTRGEKCNEIIEFNQTCDQIQMIIDKNDILSGVDPVTTYKINQSIPENSTIRLFLQEPDASIRDAQYCHNEECLPLQLEEVEDENPLEMMTRFFANWMTQSSQKGKIERIHALLSKLGQYLNKLESTRVEATYPATDEMKNQVSTYLEMEKAGLIDSLNYTEVDKAISTLEGVAKDLHLKTE